MTEADMREPTFWLLTALTEGPQHGYALLQAIDRLSDGRVRLRPGSLYGMLDRLAALGLVEDTGTETVDGRQRRYYDLTEQGTAALAGQAERMQANATRAAERLRARAAEAPRLFDTASPEQA